MANLAQQLKSELTDRARNSESCKEHLLEWVMNEFRSGENPVEIYCKKTIDLYLDTELAERLGFKKEPYRHVWVDFKYENGKHYAKYSCGYDGKFSAPVCDWVDITDMIFAQRYAVDGKDESDKRLFLESEGFKVYKEWVYGKGTLLKIYY